MFYIGIDIAKRSHQAAVTDVSGNIIVKPFNFKNTAAGFTQFLSVLETNSVSKDNCVIIGTRSISSSSNRNSPSKFSTPFKQPHSEK